MSILYWKVLASHIDKSAWLEAQVRQLLQMANQQQNKFDLRPLVEAIDTVKEKITLLESNDQRLGMSDILYFPFDDSCLHVFMKQANTWPNGVTAVQEKLVESGICKTEQHDILATRAKIMKSHNGGRKRQRVEKGQEMPGTREWWLLIESGK